MPKDKKELFFMVPISETSNIVPDRNTDNSRQDVGAIVSDFDTAAGPEAADDTDRVPGGGGTPPKLDAVVLDISISKTIPLPPTDYKKNTTSNSNKVILKDNTTSNSNNLISEDNIEKNNNFISKRKRRHISLSERIDNIIPKKEKFATHAIQSKYTKKQAKQKLPLDIVKVFKPEYKHLASVLLPGTNTKKIRKTFELTVKYDGDVKRAMREAGYSPSTVNVAAGRIIRSKSWEKLTEYYFPTVMLFEKEHELLNHPDWRAINSSLDRIHKLKGNFINKVEHSLKPGEDLKEKSDIELRRIIDMDDYIDDEVNVESDTGAELTKVNPDAI